MIKSDNSFESVMKRLTLEQIDTYLFRFKGKNAGIQRIYGGQVIAQAYVAADATIEEEAARHKGAQEVGPPRMRADAVFHPKMKRKAPITILICYSFTSY